MKLLEVDKSRDFGCFLKGVFSESFRELVFLIRKGLSLGVMLFLALTTLSFLNWGSGYLGGSVKGFAAGKHLESVVIQAPRSFVNSRQVGVRVPAAYTYEPTVRAQHSNAASARNMLRESGYLVNEMHSFTRSLARLGQ